MLVERNKTLLETVFRLPPALSLIGLVVLGIAADALKDVIHHGLHRDLLTLANCTAVVCGPAIFAALLIRHGTMRRHVVNNPNPVFIVEPRRYRP